MISKEEKTVYTAIIAQYRSEIHSLIYKLEKLDEEMDIVFVYDSIISAIYHLEDAESVLSRMIGELNYKEEGNYE